jgi:predicted ABC-class ATPase
MDGKGYKSYMSLQGSYKGEWFQLHVDYVQGDPFAQPSRVRLEVPQSVAKCEREWYESESRKIALEDFLTREVAKAILSTANGTNGSGKSGLIMVDSPGQEILSRTSVKVDQEKVEFRLSLGLPAAGRKILGKKALDMLYHRLPEIIEQAIFKMNKQTLQSHLKLVDQQEAIRRYIETKEYVAFIANGAILPRESGVSNRPLKNKQIIPFQSPPSLLVDIPVPHGNTILGMAIPKGVTLIVGGGYHGKSTLLQAIERGIYQHIPGDGREYVITNPTAYKVRAEDGRRVEKVNISPFISNLPFGTDTVRFSTENASGSTSQATNIMEALEMESQLLLVDEDTSATNFMIRDARMQELVAKGKEPITPFVDKVRQLYHEENVSTVLVIGGSGDYFDVADTVIMMDEYKPFEVTKEAQAIAEKVPSQRQVEADEVFGAVTQRVVFAESFDANRGNKEKVDVKGLHRIIFGRHDIDLSFVEQLVDPSQTRAIAMMLKYLGKNKIDGRTSITQLIDQLYHKINKHGLDVISPYVGQHPGDLALPRKFEVAAALNRLCTLIVK